MAIEPSYLVRKLVAMLEAAGYAWPGGAENARIERTHAGHWQRSAGAWSWELVTKDGQSFPSAAQTGGYVSATKTVQRKLVPYIDHLGNLVFDL